jgi:hypothetical protein
VYPYDEIYLAAQPNHNQNLQVQLYLFLDTIHHSVFMDGWTDGYVQKVDDCVNILSSQTFGFYH